jgi:hypothetical protein
MALGCMIAEGDVMISKARYRRGRARLRMGRLAEAEEGKSRFARLRA